MPPPPTTITESFGLFPFGEIRLQLWAYLAAVREGPEKNPKNMKGCPYMRASVVYFCQLLGAVHTWKLVKILFWVLLTLFLYASHSRLYILDCFTNSATRLLYVARFLFYFQIFSCTSVPRAFFIVTSFWVHPVPKKLVEIHNKLVSPNSTGKRLNLSPLQPVSPQISIQCAK